MERPGVVWLFTIFIILGILWELFSAILFFSGFGDLNGVSITVTILALLLLVPRVIMIVKFFLLQKNALLWVHISYGSILALSLIEYIIYFVTLKPGIIATALVAPPSLLMTALFIFFWWAVADYIKKKQVDGQAVFS